jgi:hypothetical protein
VQAEAELQFQFLKRIKGKEEKENQKNNQKT